MYLNNILNIYLNNNSRMNFIMNKELFDYNYLYLMDPVANNVIDNGVFHRFIYSNSYLTLNSLIFKLKMKNVRLIKLFNKYKISFDIFDENNAKQCEYITKLEKNILCKFNISEKCVYNILDNINNDNIRVYSGKTLPDTLPEVDIYFKISGIWIHENRHGVTFKFSL